MTNKQIENILPLVERPSRYLGSEINTVKKDLSKVKLRFALAFPDLYEIGTSHFGMQILYHILNSQSDIAAERVFAPGVDMEARLKSSGTSLFSLESHQPLNRFDIIGFSLLYELNYTNVLMMLDLAGIPFRAKQRDHSFPLIIAGGCGTSNPEPVADFFDAIVVGDGENVIVELSQAWLKWNQGRRRDKESLLKQWSQIEGVYIPAFFEPEFDSCGFQTLKPKHPEYVRVKRAIVADLNSVPFPEKPIVPYGKPVHDRLRLEVARGCTRGCRFCQAGMIYRPARERSPDNLLSLSAKSIAATGYEDISLLSLSSGDYGCIVPLMERLMARFSDEHVAVSLPSLRAGTLTPQLMELVKKVRKTGFTIAPEAGSQRLRDVINKNISENEIKDTIKNAFQLGWQVIKLYFMVGLPTETSDDLEALVDLVKNLRRIKGAKGRRGKINVSVATFIPKSHTPFQWASQISLAESQKRIGWVKDRLKLPGIQVKWQDPKVSLLEGIWARGDRRLSRLLETAYHKGCRFDGWSDHFNFNIWQEAFVEAGIDIDFYTTRVRDVCEPLPWDPIDTQITKEFLISEWENSTHQAFTPDCRMGACNSCGVCDFSDIEPKTFEQFPRAGAAPAPAGTSALDAVYQKLHIVYAKQGPAKYFGHLEMVNILLRAFKRTAIPLKFTEGFHPKPKVSFDDPLPIGIESEAENFTVMVSTHVDVNHLAAALNSNLPDGLLILNCTIATTGLDRSPRKRHTFKIALKDKSFAGEELAAFIENPDVTITRTNRKGTLKNINLKDMVEDIKLLNPTKLQLSLISEPGKTIRPADVLGKIFSLTEEEIKQAKITKLRAQSA